MLRIPSDETGRARFARVHVRALQGCWNLLRSEQRG